MFDKKDALSTVIAILAMGLCAVIDKLLETTEKKENQHD